MAFACLCASDMRYRKKRQLSAGILEVESRREHFQVPIQPQKNDIFMWIQIGERKYERASTQVVNRQHPSPEGDERDAFKQSADFQQKVSVCLKFYMKATP